MISVNPVAKLKVVLVVPSNNLSNILTTPGPLHIKHKTKLKFKYDYKLYAKQKERRKICPAVDVKLMNLKG